MCCCKKDVNKVFNYITVENKNSLISFNKNDGSFYFKSYYTSEIEKIVIDYEILKYDSDLSNTIFGILKKSFNQIQNSNISELSCPFDENTIYSEIVNYINLCSHGNEPDSIFEFAANLFYKYLTGHKMINCNKKLSLMFLINLLRFFGYHFYWSKGFMANYIRREKEVENWVKKSFNLNNDSRNILLKELTDWVKRNCVIALEWR